MEHSYILPNGRKGICCDLTARMSYVLSSESPRGWHIPFVLTGTMLIILTVYKLSVTTQSMNRQENNERKTLGNHGLLFS
jgi:hypothetical protein